MEKATISELYFLFITFTVRLIVGGAAAFRKLCSSQFSIKKMELKILNDFVEHFLRMKWDKYISVLPNVVLPFTVI